MVLYSAEENKGHETNCCSISAQILIYNAEHVLLRAQAKLCVTAANTAAVYVVFNMPHLFPYVRVEDALGGSFHRHSTIMMHLCVEGRDGVG